NRGLVEASPGLAKSRTLQIDRDNFDRVLAGLGVELRLPIPGDEHGRIGLQFTELEDFHPDRIYERTEAFRTLREFRRKLNDPTTFQETMRQIEFEAGIGLEPNPQGPSLGATGSDSAASASSPENLLERILEESRGQTRSAGPSEIGPLAAF